MNIQIRSVYDLKTFMAFQKYSLKKIFVLAYICGLALIGIGIWFAFTSRKSYAIYILMGIMLPIIMHVFYKSSEIEAVNKNAHLRDTTVQIFSFNDEGMSLEQISKFDNFKDKYLYKDILSIVKYKRYYFIYINRVQAFVINNEDYVLGDEQQLDDLLKKYKGSRFIVKHNSRKRVNKR